MILLDTSVLVEGLGAGGRLREALRNAIASRHRLAVPTLVLYAWLRGPRLPEELVSPGGALSLGTGARLRPRGGGPRRRTVPLPPQAPGPRGGPGHRRDPLDWRARLWTLNPDDFRDVPGLELYAGE